MGRELEPNERNMNRAGLGVNQYSKHGLFLSWNLSYIIYNKNIFWTAIVYPHMIVLSDTVEEVGTLSIM